MDLARGKRVTFVGPERRTRDARLPETAGVERFRLCRRTRKEAGVVSSAS